MLITVISPEKAIWEGEADSLVAPAFDGEIGILNRHAPFMTVLGKGVLRIGSGEGARRFTVQGGFLQVVHNRVRVLAEAVQGE